MQLIELNVPVERDEDGWWSNPAIPDFEEDAERYKEWRAGQGIETYVSELDQEDLDHPSYKAVFEEGDPQVRDWNPQMPPNDPSLGLNGMWRPFSIHDTEDGPVWVWARRRPT